MLHTVLIIDIHHSLFLQAPSSATSSSQSRSLFLPSYPSLSFSFSISLQILAMRLLSSVSFLVRRQWSNLNMGSSLISSLSLVMLLVPTFRTRSAMKRSASTVKSLDLNLVQKTALKSMLSPRLAFHSSNSCCCLLLESRSSPPSTCRTMRSWSDISPTLSQKVWAYAATAGVGLESASAMAQQLFLPCFSMALMKEWKSLLFHSLNPLCRSSFFSLCSSGVSGGHSSMPLLFFSSSSFWSSCLSLSLLRQKWCQGSTIFLSTFWRGCLVLSLLLRSLGGSWSRRWRVRASWSFLRFSSSLWRKSKMLMLSMVRLERSSGGFIFCSSCCCRRLVLASPLLRSSSMSASLMVVLVALKMALAPKVSISFISSLLRFLFLWEERCCWMTRLSHLSFIICRSMIFSSTVSSVISRYTLTSRLCPIRCALSIACRSIWGLKSLSQITTVSAAVRLMPSPPARVLSRKTKCCSVFMKASIWLSLLCMSVLPSIRQYANLLRLQQSSRMSRMEVIWEKTSTLCPPSSCSLASSLSSTLSFSEAVTRCSPTGGASGGSTLGKRQGWQQTFLSCMSRFRQYLLSSSPALLLCSRLLQILSCCSLSPTQTRISFLPGRVFSTSALVLLSMKGRSILWSCPTICTFFLSLSSGSRPSSLVSQLSKGSEEEKTSGMRKFMRLHSSCRLFWRGVPVSSSLHSVCSLLTIWESWLSSFLILCASSMTMYCHLTLLRVLMPSLTPSQLVTTMSNSLPATRASPSSLSSLVAASLMHLADGSHFWSSLIQLPMVILGAMMMCGPLMFLYSLRKASMEMDWMVFPSPMSSARMPLIPLSYRLIIQLRATN